MISRLPPSRMAGQQGLGGLKLGGLKLGDLKLGDLKLSDLKLPTFRRRPPPPPVLKPYSDAKTLRARLTYVAAVLGLALFCVIYGFFFAATAPYLSTQCLIPIVVAAGLTVWALPDMRTIPIGALSGFFTAYLVGLLIWPRYLALALPGLPWISVSRLTGVPLATLLLICLSCSKTFRSELYRRLKSVPIVWPALLCFIAAQLISLPFSHSIVASLQKVLVNQLDWTCLFVVSCFVCAPKGRVWKYLMLIFGAAAFNIVIAYFENKGQALPWAGIVPRFLQVDDADKYLEGWKRTLDGVYRSRAVFTTPLGLAEFLAILTPFYLHFIFNNFRIWQRGAAVLWLVGSAYAIDLSHSRVGVVGMFVSTVFYVLLWGLIRWRRNKGDIVGATVVYGYPALAGMAYVAAMTIPALRIRLFGSGAQRGSTQARFNQFDMAFPKFLANPIGHGAGQAGANMGYAAGAYVTIDSYYILCTLEFGALGILAFLSIFGGAILAALRTAFEEKLDPTSEDALILPIAVGLAAFLVIKLAFGQPDNHPLLFAMVGMIVALRSRRTVNAA